MRVGGVRASQCQQRNASERRCCRHRGSAHDCGRVLRCEARSHFTWRRTMAEARNGQRTSGNSSAWAILPVAGNPLLAVAANINGKWLEHVASAQKDWAEFVHRRVKEDIAASRRLMNCQSLADM